MEQSIKLAKQQIHEHKHGEVGFIFRCLKCGCSDMRFDNEAKMEGRKVIVTFYIECKNCSKQSALSTATIE